MRWDAAEISQKSMEAWQTAHRLTRERYRETVKPWRELVRGVAQAEGGKVIDVIYSMMVDLSKAGKLDGCAAMWLLCVLHDEANDEPMEDNPPSKIA